MWAIVGEDFHFPVEYTVEGEFVVPTAASASVRDHTGAMISGLEDVSLTVDTTSTTLSIPANTNTIAGDKEFSNRYVTVTFTHNGETYRKVTSFKVVPFIPLTVTAADVRNELGLDQSELPDNVIEILDAYFDLKREYGQDIEDALTGDSDVNLAVNRAVKFKAALALVDSLVFRVAIKIKAEDQAIERMGEFDVDQIRKRLAQGLSQALDVIDGETTGGSTILVLATPTDVITGA